jgi:hypothetical protein
MFTPLKRKPRRLPPLQNGTLLDSEFTPLETWTVFSSEITPLKFSNRVHFTTTGVHFQAAH